MPELKRIKLKDYTTIKIGGLAKHFFLADSQDELLNLLGKVGEKFYLLGNGSNLLIKDKLIETPIIKLGKKLEYIKNKKNVIEVGAATHLAQVLNYCAKNELSGLENLAGIPATVGGMLAMNASSFGKDTVSSLESANVIDKNGKLSVIEKKDIGCGYRFSSLKNYTILSAKISLSKKNGVKNRINNYFAKKLEQQDCVSCNCGCVFKNPDDYSAGFLIDACGLKGYCYNNAKISSKHANFIINLGDANYNDVDYLIKLAKDKVYAKFNIVLEEEIERWV